MFWEFFISLRYLKFDKKHFFINSCNILAAIGIFLGVFSLIIVISMMNGLENNIKEILFLYQPDLVISRGSLSIDSNIYENIREKLSDYDVYKVYKMPLIIKKDMTFKGIEIYFVDDNYLEEIMGFEIKEKPFLFIGKLLSMELLLREGEELELLLPFASTMNTTSIKITDIFQSQLVDIDLNNVYIQRDRLLKLFDIKSELNEIHIKGIEHQRSLNEISRDLQEKLGDNFYITNIYDKNRDLFSAMKLERIAMIIMLSLIIVLGCFNIISSLLMMVTEKTQDIGILRSFGSNKKSIRRIFAFQGLFIGFVSTFFGTLMGIIISIYLDKYQMISTAAQGLYIDYIPFKVDIGSVFLIFILSLAINAISTYIPTKNISKINIIKALYYGR